LEENRNSILVTLRQAQTHARPPGPHGRQWTQGL